MPIQEFVIESGDRDGFWISGTRTGLFNLLNNQPYSSVYKAEMTSPFETWYGTAYFVFDGLEQNKKTRSAFLHIYGADDYCQYYGASGVTDAIRINIYGMKVPSPNIPINYQTSGTAWLPKTQKISWDFSNVDTSCSGTRYTSPDISAILDEIRFLPGFTSKSYFIICMECDFVISGEFLENRRVFANYEYGLPASLVVDSFGHGRISIRDERLESS